MRGENQEMGQRRKYSGRIEEEDEGDAHMDLEIEEIMSSEL